MVSEELFNIYEAFWCQLSNFSSEAGFVNCCDIRYDNSRRVFIQSAFFYVSGS